ncbi:MAG: glycosyltransferase family 2 protein [Bacteroidetes bacterium]|nr:glycosyltransferase family 2 protein [Bacteroidota bacterium]
MDISIVIPLFNEDESLPELHAWIVRVMQENQFSYEVIFCDDGSKDKSWEVIKQLAELDKNVKGLSFRRNYGKSAALNEGFKAVEGDVVITMDADLQDSPDEIPELFKMIKEGGYDLVSGWKEKRYDPITKTAPTKLFNWATRRMSGIELHDFNCGLKAYRKDVVKSIEVYGEMHRYIPVIAKWAGFNKIGEKAVAHQARKYGTTKFGLERFTNGLLDLLSIHFVGRFGRRPMHFFGTMGMVSFLIGLMISFYLIGYKIYYEFAKDTLTRPVTDQPVFYLALVAIIVGTILFIGGFLGELISRNGQERNYYHKKGSIGVGEE